MFEHIDSLCCCEGKVCRGCTQLKCFLAFYKNPRGVKGLSGKCKDCVKIQQKAHRDKKQDQAGEPVEIPAFQHIDVTCSCNGKFCRTCAQWKCHGAFSKERKGGKGLSSTCKECIRSYQLAHRDEINEQRRKNRQEKAEHYNTYNKEYHHKNPEPKKARDQKYRQENTELVNAYMRKYKRTVYSEKARKYNHEYRQLHPEKSAQHFNNRRARIIQADGSFTSREWKSSVNIIIIPVYVVGGRSHR